MAYVRNTYTYYWNSEEVWREGEEPIGYGELDALIDEILNKFDLTNYLGADGKLTNNFINRVNVDLYLNLPGTVRRDANGRVINNARRRGRIRYFGANLVSELAGLLLYRRRNLFRPDDRNRVLGARFNEYINTFPPGSAIAYAIYDQSSYLFPQVAARRRGRAIRVQNPDTGREIKVGALTYRQIYSEIIIREVKYKDLSGYETKEYKIKDNCVFSYIEKNYGKKNANNYIPYIEKVDSKKKKYKEYVPTYKDIVKLANDIKFNLYIYTITNHEIECCEFEEPKYKALRMIIHDNHMYVLVRTNLSKSLKIKYTNDIDLEDVEDAKYTKFIIDDDPKTLNNLRNEIVNKYHLQNYDDERIKFKTNEIVFDPEYKEIIKLQKLHGKGNKSKYTLMESYLQIRGYMNRRTYDTFINLRKIRFKSSNKQSDIRYDRQKSYVSELYEYSNYEPIFPVPSITDYVQLFDNKILEGGFYYCELNSYDEILAPYDTFYYYLCVLELKKDKRIKNIKYQLVPYQTKVIEQECLPDMSQDEKKNKARTFTFDELREMTGWWRRQTKSVTTRYSNIKGKEADALIALHGREANYVNNEIIINRDRTIFKTGLLTCVAIYDLNNLALYRFNKAFLKINKNAKLNTIRTDCLGYCVDGKVKHPEDLLGKRVGLFKIENKKDACEIKDNFVKDEEESDEGINRTEPSSYLVEKVSTIYRIKDMKNDTDELEKLIKNKESMIISAIAGSGKTYNTEHIIIPMIEKYDMKYILTSTTTHNAKMIEGVTLDSLFLKKFSNADIINNLNDIDYIIIDEAVQLTQELFCKLEFIVRNTETALILLSDEYQCIRGSYNGKPFITTRFAKWLCDYNKVVIEVHKHMRYDKELLDILLYIIEHFDDVNTCIDYVKKKFPIIKKTKDIINLSYTNTTRRLNWKEDRCKCETDEECKKYHNMTIHGSQGDTIEKNYTIHDIERLRKQPTAAELFTAISRARKKTQISLKLKRDDE